MRLRKMSQQEESFTDLEEINTDTEDVELEGETDPMATEKDGKQSGLLTDTSSALKATTNRVDAGAGMLEMPWQATSQWQTCLPCH